MKKTVLGLLLATASCLTANAQLSEGGLPASRLQPGQNGQQYVPTATCALPDWNKAIKESEQAEANGRQQPYLVALFAQSDISFPASGTLVKAADGGQIWRAAVRISGAKAIGLYYDRFKLPKGVRMFLSNASGNQVLGAFTQQNNAPSGAFATEAVQGDMVQIELDIAPGVNISDIDLHINRPAVYFRGIENLAAYAYPELGEIDAIDTALSGSSSVCMINAACPLGVNYQAQRRATFQTLIPVGGQGVAACSATMINAVGNTPGNCKQYYLTATHCDQENGTTNSHFDQVILRFNFERSACNATAVPSSNTITGANFIARANYDENAPATDIKGDFLLMELRQAIPASWNVTLSGWNNNAGISRTVAAPKKFIGFHHPNGDVKKVSSAQAMESTPLDPSFPQETHWGMFLDSGLVSTGSSGSGLFDGDGYLIGVASVAGPQGLPASCNRTAAGQAVTGTANVVLYSKFSYVWDYTIDGNANNRKLKPWLDAANSGAVTINPVKSNCSPLDNSTGISVSDNRLDEAISLYPNPSTTGKVNIQLNLKEASDMSFNVYDLSGKQVKSFRISHVQTGAYSLDLGGLPNGMYLIKCSDGYSVAAKKVMLAH